jgi:hypothetical protein
LKKRLLIIPTILVSVIAIMWMCLVFYPGYIAKNPFKYLKNSDIISISINLHPFTRGRTVLIDDNERIKEIVYILNSVVTYGKSATEVFTTGQVVQFTLLMKNGNTLNVETDNTYLFVNGKFYKASYEPCNKLSSIGKILTNN